MDALPDRGSGDGRPDALSGLSYREVIDGVPDAVIVTDPDGSIVLWNTTAERLYGWSEREVLGRAVVELLVPTADDDLGRSAPTRPLTAGYEGDRLLITKAGALRDVHVTTRPVLNAAGELAAIVGVSSDIRELKAAQRALEDAGASLRAALAGEIRRHQ
jgi:PAS domain S-box-containing protein